MCCLSDAADDDDVYDYDYVGGGDFVLVGGFSALARWPFRRRAQTRGSERERTKALPFGCRRQCRHLVRVVAGCSLSSGLYELPARAAAADVRN